MKKPSDQKAPTVQDLILKAMEILRDLVATLPPHLKAVVVVLLIIAFAGTRSPWIDILRHCLGA